MKTGIIAATTSVLFCLGIADAAELKVLSTQATEPAHTALVPQFEQASGHKVNRVFTGTLDANKRLAAGETYDLLIRSSASIDEHIKGGKVVPGTRVDIAKSGVALAVRAGAPKPDISTPDAFKKTVLAAKTIGYSTGPSGNYIISLFERMGIAEEVKPKLRQTPTGGVVASIIANGEAEIGFQQVSELSAAPGVDYVGPLPAQVRHMTVFASGIAVAAKEPEAARALVGFISAPAAASAFTRRGMEPGTAAASRATN